MSRFLLVSMLLIAACMPCSAADLTPAAVRTMLQTQDATSLVQQLDNGDDGSNAWFEVLDHIERGEQDWLDLVPLLAPGTDAGTAEAMVITLSRALTTNATGVLTIMAGGLYTVDYVCRSTEIEPPPKEVAAFLDAAIPAVAAVLDPKLRRIRDACLRQLKADRASVTVS